MSLPFARRSQEVGQARQLNKKLTAELQATSALLNSAAKAAELLQKQKEKSRALESQLRGATRELESLKERRPGSSELGSDEHEMLLDALQRQQQDAAELRRQLAARDEQIQQLSGGGVQVRSPLKMDPADLLRGQSRARAEGPGPDPVIQVLWTDDDAESPRAIRSGRAPLGSLDSNGAPVQLIGEGQKQRKPQAVRIGRGCTCGGCTIDDAGNFRLMCSAADTASTENEQIIDLGMDGEGLDGEYADEYADEAAADEVEQYSDGNGEQELDLAGAEENANAFDEQAAKSSFGEGPVPGGHAPYYCTSLDCELAVVKTLGWSGGDGTELEDEEGAPAGCGRVMEGQLRFDSARYGAALDIVFTGSVEHLRDQEWQNDEACKECTSCQSQFGMLNRRHHCRVCGVIYCSDCLLRSLPYFVPEEEPEEAATTTAPMSSGTGSPGSEFRSNLALTVCDQDGPEIPGSMPGQVKRAAILSCHTCFSMLQILAVAQAGPDTSGLRFSMCHAGS